MSEHTGFHEYKDGKRFNPECLACLAEDRDKKKLLLYLGMRSLVFQLHALRLIIKGFNIQDIPTREDEL